MIIKVGNEEMKRKVMSKNKLRGGRIYLKNDLSFEERTQMLNIDG